MPIADRFQLVWTPFLKKQKGRMLQAVGLVCPTVLGSGGELTLHVGARKYTARKIDLLRYPTEIKDQNAPVTYLWLIPRPAGHRRVRAVWKTPLGQVYRDSFVLKPAEPTNVHVIFKTHLDLGYTQRIDEVIRLYQTRFMEKLLDNLDATAGRAKGKRFVWTLSTWLLEQCLDPRGVAPEYLQRLEKYIRDGSVVWGLMPFTTHSEFFGLEEMCRSIYSARRLAERFERPVPTAAKMTDVPAHTASLGMAFASAGGKFFQLGVNPESLPPAVPPLFWWKLPDGQRLLCHYHETYGTPLLPPQDWPWCEWPAIQITSDNVGPQSLETIYHIDWIESHFDSPVCRTGRLEDFAEAVIRRYGKLLPVVDKEFVDWWVYGIGSQADVTAMTRRDKERLPQAETVQTLSDWAAAKPPGVKKSCDVTGAYQQLALFTEHTWGDHAHDTRAALPKGNPFDSDVFASGSASPPVDRWIASWQDKANFARAAHAGIDRLETQALASFATQLGGSGSDVGIALFNTLNWPRGGRVRLEDSGLPGDEFELVDPSTQGAVLYERGPGWIEFVAPPVPPCGYLVLEVKSGRRSRPGLSANWDGRTLSLHTDDTTLQFHKAGGIARWHDRARSTQWCSGEAEFPLGTYLYEMPGTERMRAFARAVHTNFHPMTIGFHRRDFDKMPQFGPAGGGSATVRPEITPLYTRVTVEADCPTRKAAKRRSGDARRYRSTFTLYRGLRDLHVNVELIGKRPTYAPEAGYAFFPFAGEKPHVLVDRIAHLVNPARGLVKSVNATHLAVHRGLRIQGKHAGMNFYPLHTPLVSFGQPGAYRFSGDPVYPNGLIYATLFNNCWGTNFAQWQSGDFSFDFVLRPTGNVGADGGLAQGGAEVFRPLLATVVTGRRAGADAARSLLTVQPQAVQLVTLKAADFEAGTVIRLWNSHADSITARLTLPAMRRGDSLWKCDLLERTSRRAIAVNGEGEATIPLRPHEIATLLLRPENKSR